MNKNEISSRYTNGVLTVIALALCALVYQNATLGAMAAKGDEQCGSRFNPCYVASHSSSGVDVRITNWP